MNKLASELLAVARQVMAEDLPSLQEQLNDLNNLSLNLERAFSDFGQHFRNRHLFEVGGRYAIQSRQSA